MPSKRDEINRRNDKNGMLLYCTEKVQHIRCVKVVGITFMNST